MKLKRVRIFGFKTFAEKTEIEVDGDLIAIVGPNGCGKSNIVDAILWGLGETSAKNLRAQTGKDVVFSGSKARKALGYAEVSLVFDNEDGSLPVPTPEVMITRRVTRGGDSKYAINGRRCRLRDVADLLADSGLGRAGYAIVSQSDIDQALSASAIQRRAWIDEAAGVQRYRVRRQESLRRLDAAQSHLDRVADLVSEIERQRAPLAAEAEKAKRYREIRTSLQEIEEGLLSVEIAEAAESQSKAEDQMESSRLLSEKEARQAEDLARLAQEVSAEAAALERKLEELRDERQRTEREAERTRSLEEVARGKLESLADAETRLEEEEIELRERLKTAKAEASRAIEEDGKASRTLERIDQEMASVDAEAKKLADALAEAEANLKAVRGKAEAHQRASLESARRAERKAEIDAEISGVADALPELETALAEAQKTMDGHEAKISAEQDALKALEAELASLRKRAEEKSAKAHRMESEAARHRAQQQALEATIEAHEGMSQGARAVLEAVERGELADEYRAISEAIDVPSQYAKAIEVALGAAANDLIVPGEREAKAGIELLKRTRRGRCTFQPINLVRPSSVPHELNQMLRQGGVCGRAAELIDFDQEGKPVIESLLGRIVIVESLDVALRLAKSRGWSRLVTLDGEVVHSRGSVSGGQTKHDSAGIVRRRAEAAELARKADAAGKEAAKLRIEAENAEAARASKADARQEIEQRIQDARSEAGESQRWLTNLRHEHDATRRSHERLASELAKVSEEVDVTEMPDLKAAEAARDAAMQELAARTGDSTRATQRMEDMRERARAVAELRRDAERRLAETERALERREERAGQLAPNRQELKDQAEEAKKRQAELSQAIDGLTEAIKQAAEGKARKAAEALEKREQAEKARQASSKASQEFGKAEVARARAESKRANAVQKLLEEYGVTEEEALTKAPEIELPKDARTIAAQLRRDMRQMGEVNLGAIEAYDRLDVRHAELAGQSEDIEQGMEEIRSGIAELDKLTRDRFIDAFQKIKEAFAVTFTEIFGGGEAELSMSEGDEMLDAGVEIQVTVPGKKRQRLELLSGGERALSATAFLFALLRVKPTPLVILDEVDAPLDGRNVERFISMLRGFTEIQFVCVSHNPATIAAADVWFGVTMQEPGVSTVVPLKNSGASEAVIEEDPRALTAAKN